MQISCDKEYLSVNGKQLLAIKTDKKNGTQNFESSEYDYYYSVKRLRSLAAVEKMSGVKSIVAKFNDELEYSIIKSVLRSIGEGGFREILLNGKSEDFRVKLCDSLSVGGFVYPKNPSNAVYEIISYPEYLDIISKANNKTIHRDSVALKDTQAIKNAIKGIRDSDLSSRWLIYYPYLKSNFSEMKSILSIINSASSGMFKICLGDIFTPWEEICKDPPNDTSSSKIKRLITPPNELGNIEINYPEWGLRNCVGAHVSTTVVIDTLGKVTKLKIKSSGGKDFDNAVISVLKKMRYSPYIINGIKYPACFERIIEFKIPDNEIPRIFGFSRKDGDISIENDGHYLIWSHNMWLSF